MRILIAGFQGMLGTDLMEVFGDHDIRGADLPGFDITRAADCLALAREFRPDAVVNAAALTAVDYCESHGDEAFLVNGRGAGNLAEAAAAVAALSVYYSTDYVFDGTKAGPYVEDDVPNPMSVYGKSKLRGEELVRAAGPDHLILRTSWLFGVHGQNFVRTIHAAACKGQTLRVVNDQRGSPTYAADLARHTRRMVEADCRGTFHVTNSGSCSWFELARSVVERSGLAVEVLPVTTAEFPRPAPRPPNSVLANRRLEAGPLPRMRPWPEAVREYLSHLLASNPGTR